MPFGKVDRLVFDVDHWLMKAACSNEEAVRIDPFQHQGAERLASMRRKWLLEQIANHYEELAESARAYHRQEAARREAEWVKWVPWLSEAAE
jgi:hypothetical protein